MRRRVMRRSAWAWAALAPVVALALAACGTETPMPVPTEPSHSSSSAEPTPTPEPEPVLDLQGTAIDNLAYFDKVNRALVEAGGTLDGRAFIDNLVAAGFPKASMEVTPDRTTINAQADQLQFSVRINGTCLLGQYGGGAYNGAVADILATGTCLVGTTRPIDW